MTRKAHPASAQPTTESTADGAKRSSYHHGSLRDTLVDACTALVEAEGIGAVSLRRVAREAGVSPGAPYHHFADRAALLSAIAARGFDLLADELRRAVRDASGDPRAESLAGAVRAYVHFAEANRGHFLVMFRPELSEPEKHPDVRDAGARALGVLTDLVGGPDERETRALAMSLWSFAHGIASLDLDGQFGHTAGKWSVEPDALLDATIERFTNALAADARG